MGEHKYLDEPHTEIKEGPEDGAYAYGLFCEGARWSKAKKGLDDPLPKELFAVMPVIHLDPIKDKQVPTGGIYRCPVYKILTRTGVPRRQATRPTSSSGWTCPQTAPTASASRSCPRPTRT